MSEIQLEKAGTTSCPSEGVAVLQDAPIKKARKPQKPRKKESKKRKSRLTPEEQAIPTHTRHYRKHREQIRAVASVKHNCPCGGIFTLSGITHHKRTKRHQAYMAKGQSLVAPESKQSLIPPEQSADPAAT